MVIMFPSEGTGMTVDDELVASIDGGGESRDRRHGGGWVKKMRLDLDSVTS
jgi:hypothetical protein